MSQKRSVPVDGVDVMATAVLLPVKTKREKRTNDPKEPIERCEGRRSIPSKCVGLHSPYVRSPYCHTLSIRTIQYDPRFLANGIGNGRSQKQHRPTTTHNTPERTRNPIEDDDKERRRCVCVGRTGNCGHGRTNETRTDPFWTSTLLLQQVSNGASIGFRLQRTILFSTAVFSFFLP